MAATAIPGRCLASVGVDNLDVLRDKVEDGVYDDVLDRLDPDLIRRRLVILGAGRPSMRVCRLRRRWIANFADWICRCTER